MSVSVSRPLLTAGAAGLLLCGLYFVPSAHGGAHSDVHRQAAATRDGGYADTARARQLAIGDADTDATPYVIGGAAVLSAGTALVARAVRKKATTPAG